MHSADLVINLNASNSQDHDADHFLRGWRQRSGLWIWKQLLLISASFSSSDRYVSNWLFIYQTVWAQRKIMLLIWTEKCSLFSRSLWAPCAREHDRIETDYAKCVRANHSSRGHVAASLGRKSHGTVVGAGSGWLRRARAERQQGVKTVYGL